MRLKTLTLGEKYVFKKNFYPEGEPLSWYVKKGEIATYENRTRGRVQMRAGNWRLIDMSRKDALDYLDEIVDREGVRNLITKGAPSENS